MPRDGWLARQADKIKAQEPAMRAATRFIEAGGRGMTDGRLWVRFDGPPSHDSGRFIELETESGRSIGPDESRAGWYLQNDGTWLLGPFSRVEEAAPSTDEGEAQEGGRTLTIEEARIELYDSLPHPFSCGGREQPRTYYAQTCTCYARDVVEAFEAAIRAPLEADRRAALASRRKWIDKWRAAEERIRELEAEVSSWSTQAETSEEEVERLQEALKDALESAESVEVVLRPQLCYDITICSHPICDAWAAASMTAFNLRALATPPSSTEGTNTLKANFDGCPFCGGDASVDIHRIGRCEGTKEVEG